jgi:hypothetical protein
VRRPHRKMMDEVYAARIAKLISAYDKKYIEVLRTEIASLRADVGILRGIIKSHNVASIKGKADARMTKSASGSGRCR